MTAFFKLSGAGNDFIALVEPAADPAADAVRAWCRRGLSLGADGVMALSREAAGAVVMKHWNADGGRAELCLNGSRCAVRLAESLGWADGGAVKLRTDAGLLEGQNTGGNRVEIDVPFAIDAPAASVLETEQGVFRGWSIRVGVPHLVVFLDGGAVEDLDLAAVAPDLRRHADLGPEGANVNFVESRGRRSLAIRTWERGVEAETLACGTGAVASVFAGLAAGAVEAPAELTTASGFVLGVDRRGDGARLGGDARIVARGELLNGSL